MELRFHFEEKCFYQENGELQEESGETLEELEEHYENMCYCYNKLPEPKINEKGEVDWE